MASLRRSLGIVVVVLGLLLVALPFTGLIAQVQNAPEMSSGFAAPFTPAIFGGGTLKVSWTGAGPNTVVTVYDCPGDTSCGSAHDFGSLTTVASGNGASGSLSASVTGGTTYLIAEQGTTGGLNVSMTVSGLTILTIIAVAVVVVGLVLVALPVRKPSLTPEEEEQAAATAAANAAAPEEVVLAAPSSGPAPTMTPTRAAPLIPRAPEAAPSEESNMYQSGEDEPETVASSATPTGGSRRPNIKCPNCGTMNEPWITNCRWCKRTLTSTG